MHAREICAFGGRVEVEDAAPPVAAGGVAVVPGPGAEGAGGGDGAGELAVLLWAVVEAIVFAGKELAGE